MINPINGWVLVRPIKEENTTKSGLFIPSSPMQTRQGDVIWTSDTEEADCPVRIDDRILFHKAAGLEVRDNEETLLMLKFDSIMGYISNESR